MDQIGNIRFTLMGEADIHKLSVMEVTSPKSYTKGAPTKSGINDLRMGAMTRLEQCGTCGENVKNCIGHFGHITLVEPVYHVYFIDKLISILNAVCPFCSLFLHKRNTERKDDTLMKPSREAFIIETKQAKSRSRCYACVSPTPSYRRQHLSIEHQWNPKAKFTGDKKASPDDIRKGKYQRKYAKQRFTARDALEILQNITPDTQARLGLSVHPTNLIITALLVPPRVLRPTVIQSYGSLCRGEDDLTSRLLEILRKNIELRTLSAGSKRTDVIAKLQLLTSSYMNKKADKRSKKRFRDLSSRIGKKKGRVRWNIMGKRVDNSARSVVIPGANLDIDEIGIPAHIALTLVKPVMVYKKNLQEMCQRILKGAVLGGALTICTAKGVSINLKITKNLSNIKVEPGCIVYRPLQDGDWVGVNRHPSLHKKSFMGHRVKIVSGHALQLNLAVTTGYNADFDGDEMNIHAPLSIEACCELEQLMSVESQQLNSANNKPAIAIVMNTLLGAYLLTDPETFLTEAEAMNVFMSVDRRYVDEMPPPCILKPSRLWSGKQLVSILLPRYVNVIQKEFTIRRGELLEGILDKSRLGCSRGGLVHSLLLDCGNKVAGQFNSDLQRMVAPWLSQRGFSVGLADIIPNDPHHQTAERQRHITKVNANLKTYQGSAPIMDWGSSITNNSGAIVMKTHGQKKNSVFAMMESGSKGNPVNMLQMSACVGQTVVAGAGIRRGISKRTLSCFTRNETSLLSRGFIANSFVEGVGPADFFYHSMGGREGLVDTAVKTANIGYMQRRLIKALESCKVEFDTSVRNAQCDIIQFRYGGDNADGQFLEQVRLPFLNPAFNITEMFDDRYAAYKKLLQTHRLQLMWYCSVEQKAPELAFVSVNLKKIMASIMYSRDPGPVITECDIVTFYSSALAIMQDDPLLMNYLLYFMNPQIFIDRWQITLVEFKVFRVTVHAKYRRSRIHPGEMVGVLAAQSCSEPATQMTLNTFHLAGQMHDTVNNGIPRLSELLNVTPVIRHTFITGRVKPSCNLKHIGHLQLTRCIQGLSHVSSVDFDQPTQQVVTRYKGLTLTIAETALLQQTQDIIKIDLHRSYLCERDRVPVDVVNMLTQTSLVQDTFFVLSPIHFDVWFVLIFSKNQTYHQDLMHHISNNISIGIPGVFHCQVTENDHVKLSGGDLKHIINSHMFDPYSISTNNIAETAQWMGITAANYVLAEEFYRIYEAEGAVFDRRHIQLITDFITFNGIPMPIQRHELRKLHTGVLLQASFEETMTVFRDAALHGAVDEVSGVSEKIYLGRKDWGGSGMCTVVDPIGTPVKPSVAMNDPQLDVIVSSVTERVEEIRFCKPVVISYQTRHLFITINFAHQPRKRFSQKPLHPQSPKLRPIRKLQMPIYCPDSPPQSPVYDIDSPMAHILSYNPTSPYKPVLLQTSSAPHLKQIHSPHHTPTPIVYYPNSPIQQPAHETPYCPSSPEYIPS